MTLANTFGALIVLITVSACVAPPPARRAPPSERARVQLAGNLSRELAVEGASMDFSSGVFGSAVGQVYLHNKTSRRVTILYSFVWFDRAGRQAGVTDDTRRQATLLPGQSITLQETTPMPSAIDFRVHIGRK